MHLPVPATYLGDLQSNVKTVLIVVEFYFK